MCASLCIHNGDAGGEGGDRGGTVDENDRKNNDDDIELHPG